MEFRSSRAVLVSPTHLYVKHHQPHLLAETNSQPRIETTIELRPVNGAPFTCRSVGFELRTDQAVSLPSTLGSNNARKSVRIAADPMVYAPPIGLFSQEMLALDVPIIVPLDRSVVPSAAFDSWGATTVHHLIVKATVGVSAADETTFVQSFAVPIKTYDSLPLYRQYNEPVRDVQISGDNQVQTSIVLSTSAVGPQDPISLSVTVAANCLHRRLSKNLQLKQITVQLKELLECFDGGLPVRKENKLYSSTKEFMQHLTTEGVSCEFLLVFPYYNDLLDLYTENIQPTALETVVQQTSTSFTRNSNFLTLIEGIPLTHVRGFTLVGKLYALRYELVLKVKVGHGKDFEYSLPITVSPFDRESSAYLIDWIKKECLNARERFGKATIAKFASSHAWDVVYRDLKRLIPPPSVYMNTRADWVKLGYNPEAYGRPKTVATLSDYID